MAVGKERIPTDRGRQFFAVVVYAHRYAKSNGLRLRVNPIITGFHYNDIRLNSGGRNETGTGKAGQR